MLELAASAALMPWYVQPLVLAGSSVLLPEGSV